MFELGDLLAPGAGGAPQSAMGGFVLGVVAENNDKKFAGMVKVEYTAWQQGHNLTHWMPVLQSYAGAGHGRYWLPEIDDVVLVGFVGQSMDEPFVLGCLHPANAELPGRLFHKDNRRRHLKTKGGVELDILDEDGKEQASVTTPKGLKLLVEDENETITLTDKNQENLLVIDSKNGKVTVTADSQLTLQSGRSTLEMKGKGGQVTIKCDKLEVDVTQTAKLAAKAMMTLEGGSLTAQGKQQAAFKGGAMAELSGGVVKIN